LLQLKTGAAGRTGNNKFLKPVGSRYFESKMW